MDDSSVIFWTRLSFNFYQKKIIVPHCIQHIHSSLKNGKIFAKTKKEKLVQKLTDESSIKHLVRICVSEAGEFGPKLEKIKYPKKIKSNFFLLAGESFVRPKFDGFCNRRKASRSF